MIFILVLFRGRKKTFRRLFERFEQVRYSALRIKHIANNSIVLPSRSDVESDFNDCGAKISDSDKSSSKTRVVSECSLAIHDCIRMNDYPCDVFTVETNDGFLVEIHRLRNVGKPAVLLQHGILGDSGHWVSAGPEHGLGKFKN